MISKSDSFSTLEMKNSYVILPQNNQKIFSYYKKRFKAKKVPLNFEYSSDLNGKFLSLRELERIIFKEEKKINE